MGPLAAADGVDGLNWAKQEFGGAPLGDARLSERLVEIAQSKAEKTGCAFTGVAEGDWPAVKLDTTAGLENTVPVFNPPT